MSDLKRSAAAWLASQGRNGDKMLAHITPAEAALLKKHGGAGTINPDTGLPEFYITDGAGKMSGGNGSQPGKGSPGNGGGSGGKEGGNDIDPAAAKALKDAFGPEGQAERQMDTPSNAKAAHDAAAAKGTPEQIAASQGLPPGYNPMQYEPNPTPSYEATPSNIAKVAMGAVGAVAMPGIGIGAGPAISDAVGMGFDNPTGPAPGADRMDHAPGQDDNTEVADDPNGLPIIPKPPAKPPVETPVQDPWLYPEDPDAAAGVDDDPTLTDEERRRRGKGTSIIVLGQGGLAI